MKELIPRHKSNSSAALSGAVALCCIYLTGNLASSARAEQPSTNKALRVDIPAQIKSAKKDSKPNKNLAKVKFKMLKVEAIRPVPGNTYNDIDIELMARNLSEKPVEFTYIRAVFFGDEKALCTAVYAKEILQAQRGIDITRDVDADDADRVGIGGVYMPGDEKSFGLLMQIKTAGDFMIKGKEDLDIVVQSANTKLAIPPRYTKRTMRIELLDKSGNVIAKDMLEVKL